MENWITLLLLLVATVAIAQPKAMTEVEMPVFAGCNHIDDSKERRQCSNQKLAEYVNNEIQYPDSARLEGVEGTIVVRFTVDSQGNTVNPIALNDIGGGCATEAIRVVANMPSWEPAHYEGFKHEVELTLPVFFELEEGANTPSDDFSIQWGNIKGSKISKKMLLENTDRPLLARDEMGNEVAISELTFFREKGGKMNTAKSAGKIRPDMIRLIEKLKPGNQFHILAVVQKKGKFIEIERSYTIVEEKKVKEIGEF